MSRPRSREWLALAAALALVYGGMHLWRKQSDERWADEIAANARGAEIVMYSTQSCIYCARARAWLDTHRIAFTECDIERSLACLVRYQALGAPGTPTFEVRGARLLGFSPQAVAEALRRPTSGARPDPAAPRSGAQP
jgi:glutaredoxin